PVPFRDTDITRPTNWIPFGLLIAGLVPLVFTGRWRDLNSLRWSLLALAALFSILLPVSRRFAAGYARYTTLTLVAIVILMPFAWLVCAAFKDKSVLNEHMFLPPVKTWFSEQVLLDG